MNVICIFDCDEWKSTDSMRLIYVASEQNFEKIMSKIQKDHGYTDEEMETYIHTESYTVDEYE